jgi:hypothetical protein
MVIKEKLELEVLKNRKEFCTKAISDYNKKLPKKILIAFGMGLLYAVIRLQIDPKEDISFFTTLVSIITFLIIIILINHVRLIRRIKRDIKELDAQIVIIKSDN